MGTTTETPDIPATVIQEVQRLEPQIKTRQSAQRLWNGLLSLEEREILGDDWYEAYCRLGTLPCIIMSAIEILQSR